MNKYEAMIIVKPDLSEEARKELFAQIHDAITKKQGIVADGAVWAEKRKFFFPINKFNEGVYYLVHFSISPLAVKEVTHTFKLNENILRTLITKVE